jgi:hypothetical protein
MGWRADKSAWVALAAFALLLVYVANAWTPTHYGAAAALLGLDHAGPIFGEAHEIRSDDWALTTPYFQIAVANRLGPVDLTSPFRQSLTTFFALPSRDWSMAFKPDLWGFLVLDPAHAYSLHFAILAAAMLAGLAIVLRQLGCSPGFALAGTAMIFFSQFVQAWWTSNAPVFAWAAWPIAAYLWPARWYFRLPAIGYAVAVWLIGQPYLPFVVAAGCAFAVAIAAFRPDALHWRRLAPAVAAAAAGAAIAWLHFADLIPVMRDTVYPGHRRTGGGGMNGVQLFAHLFPYLLTADFEPIGLWPSNACEIAVVGSFLPLATVAFADHRALVAWMRDHRRAVVIWLVGVDLLAAWTVLSVPGGALVPILNQAPGYRMAWGFGLLFLIGFLIAGSGVPWVISRGRIAAFAGVVVAAWAVSKLALSHGPLAAGRFDLVILAILAWLLLTRFAAPKLMPARRVVLISVAATSAITFGRFNPIQPAGPIFERHPSSPVLNTLRAYAAANPRRWAITTGWYGATINGAGVSAINHILLRPDLPKFRRAYPTLTPSEINLLFNRYQHLIPDVRWSPVLLNDDVVAIPPDPFAIPLTVTATPSAARPTTGGTLERVDSVPLGGRRWGVTAEGWASWKGVAPGQALAVSAPLSLGRIVSASAYRLPRPDIVAQRRDPAAFAAGYGLRMEFEAARPMARFPASQLRIVPVDAPAAPRGSAAP